jgi:hypothetical protein
MVHKAKFSLCSEIHTKHTNSMRSQCRIFKCQTVWCVKLPEGFKKLNIFNLNVRCRLKQIEFNDRNTRNIGLLLYTTNTFQTSQTANKLLTHDIKTQTHVVAFDCGIFVFVLCVLFLCLPGMYSVVACPLFEM